MAKPLERLNPTPTPQAEEEPSVVEPEIIATVAAGEHTEEVNETGFSSAELVKICIPQKFL